MGKGRSDLDAWVFFPDDSGPQPGQRDPVMRRSTGVSGAPLAKVDHVDIDIDKAASAWRLDALCAQIDADIFHSDDLAEMNEAKRICQRCPVIDACRDHALTAPEREGVWGGMTARQRRRYLHEKKKKEAQ